MAAPSVKRVICDGLKGCLQNDENRKQTAPHREIVRIENWTETRKAARQKDKPFMFQDHTDRRSDLGFCSTCYQLWIALRKGAELFMLRVTVVSCSRWRIGNTSEEAGCRRGCRNATCWCSSAWCWRFRKCRCADCCSWPLSDRI